MPAREFESGIHTTFQDDLDYSKYVRLDMILTAQEPLSQPEHHDETLFIVQHQTTNWWMLLAIHELRASIKWIPKDQLEPCFKILARVKQIQRMLFEQWSVLETLTPSEYVQFRHVSKNASGFQSRQFRTIEFLFGNKDRDAVQVIIALDSAAFQAPEFLFHGAAAFRLVRWLLMIIIAFLVDMVSLRRFGEARG